jgi:hypothetical protein
VCRRWFLPSARTRRYQQTCGSDQCRAEQRRRTQRRYREDNPDYWRERRLRRQMQQAPTGDERLVRPPPPQLAGVPRELVQDAIGVQPTVMIGFFVRFPVQVGQDKLGIPPIRDCSTRPAKAAHGDRAAPFGLPNVLHPQTGQTWCPRLSNRG